MDRATPPERRCGNVQSPEARAARSKRAIANAVASIPDEHAQMRKQAEAILADNGNKDYLALAGHWGKAILKWTAAGCPTRTRAERQAIYEKCRACPDDMFDRDNQSCTVCGCTVKKSLLPVNDKAAMATEVCGKGHWK